MEKFDISKLTPELKNELCACRSAEEVKALFASKNLDASDCKPEAIMKLCKSAKELDLDDLDQVGGGCGGGNSCGTYDPICPTFDRENCEGYCTCS